MRESTTTKCADTDRVCRDRMCVPTACAIHLLYGHPTSDSNRAVRCRQGHSSSWKKGTVRELPEMDLRMGQIGILQDKAI